MMQIKSGEFPNPILAIGRDDYSEDSSYDFWVDVDDIAVSQEYIEIPVHYNLVCKSFDDLMAKDEITSIVKVKSSTASFCKIFKFNPCEKDLKILIPKYDVVGNIELTGLIVANKELKRFACPEMNQLYFAGTTFDFRKGDALAISASRTIYIDDSELEKPIVSIFTINRGHDQTEDIIVDFSNEKVIISLSERLNDMYWALKDFNNGALRRYVHAVIVTPALIEAIEAVKSHYLQVSEEDYSQSRWFRAIEHKAEKIGINMEKCVESSTMIADKMLGNIVLDALKSFKDTLEQEMDSGETLVMGGVD